MKKPAKISQLELEIDREREPDRNHKNGGRSFYFFDLDDNVFFLTTPIYIYQKHSDEKHTAGREVALSSREWALHHHEIGKTGLYENYFIDPTDGGSFRRFRDVKQDGKLSDLQPFLEDLITSLQISDLEWKGPSWQTFFHATFNYRPTSIITARGHSPETIKAGIDLLVKEGHLPNSPNYLSIYPVSNPSVQNELSQNDENLSVAELKMRAIIQSVEKAMEQYGLNPHHRFGMSDDDPKNLELIFEAMRRLKNIYPENSFFVIQSYENGYIKQEVFSNRIETQPFEHVPQLSLF